MIQKSIIRRFVGFSSIGVINTLIHLVLVTGMVELFVVHPVVANCIAFIVANIFSFYANSRWNYKTPMQRDRYKRFLIISFGGLFITAGLSAFANALGFHYLVGIAMVFVALPSLTFIAHHWWTWGR